jgi:hypothetical protein|tara:strand:- start:10495 stop:10737 length:243 start_codon:yes stop_codon:yes gene_type:complete
MAKQQLRWKPTHAGIVELPDELLAVIKKGLLKQGYKLVLTEANMLYLQGVADAGIDGAAELIAAIKKHKEIDLTIIDLEP